VIALCFIFRSEIDRTAASSTHIIKMITVSPSEFGKFVAENAGKYPYNQIFKTRQKFHVKWLLTRKENRGFIPRNKANYTAIPSSCIDEGLVQYLIITKQVLPIPPVMERIMDWMYCWGRAIDGHWYNKVVDWLHFLVVNKIHLSDNIVLRDCVEYRVRSMIRTMHTNLQQHLCNMLIVEWRHYFNNEYANGHVDFFKLSVRSMGFVQARIPSLVVGSYLPVLPLS
jgi:hypothetical protein